MITGLAEALSAAIAAASSFSSGCGRRKDHTFSSKKLSG
jgi:hypothetical protein